MRDEVRQSVGVFDCVVTSRMCATLDGAAIHPVYSTFWLCYHAEVASRRAIEAFFDPGENAVGGSLSIDHKAMCAVGDTVRIQATVCDVSARKIVCRIEAYSSKGLIATGEQTQILLPQSRIDALVEEAYKF